MSTLGRLGVALARRNRTSAATTAIGCALAVSASPASAATYKVHDGASLVAAVHDANSQAGPSTIELSSGGYTPTETLTIGRDITFAGASTTGPRIAGGAVLPVGSSLFVVRAHAHATFLNLSVTNAGAIGGSAAIDVSGSADLENSTIGGSLGPGLAVEPGASATVRNSTLSDGLGVGLVDDGSVKLVNATVAGNAVEGIDDSNGALSLVNTIVAGNGSPDCSAPAGTSVHSLDGDGTCGVGALTGTNPRLGPLLASNGGPTPTHALGPGSPAINAGDASQCPSEDQRHYARSDGSCDLGAYEAGAQPAGGAPAPARPGPPGTGATRPAGKRRAARVDGHGSLRGPRHSRITFSVRAGVAAPHGSVVYGDPARRVSFKSASLASVQVDAAGGTATVKGSGTELVRRRRVTFTAVLTNRAGVWRMRLTLSSGYAGGGRLISGAITLITAGA